MRSDDMPAPLVVTDRTAVFTKPTVGESRRSTVPLIGTPLTRVTPLRTARLVEPPHSVELPG